MMRAFHLATLRTPLGARLDTASVFIYSSQTFFIRMEAVGCSLKSMTFFCTGQIDGGVRDGDHRHLIVQQLVGLLVDLGALGLVDGLASLFSMSSW